MPYHEEMNWDQSKRRWHRYHKGVMYRVPASKLGPTPTRDATRQSANAWWRRKEVELDSYSVDLAEQLAQPRPMIVSDDLVALPSGPMSQEEAANLLAPKSANPDRSIQACGQSFLTVIRVGMQPRTYEEVASFIQNFSKRPEFRAGEADVEIINEDLVEKLYLQLCEAKLSDGRKKKHWGFFRRFVHYLWERRLVAMPRNLASHKFQVSPQAVKTYPTAKVRHVLATLKSRLKLYALLGLNCGMTNVDIAALKKDEVDRKRGTITRRRSKTGDNDNVPTVRYKLWPETVRLLRKHQSTHPRLFLTNMRGNPLCGTRIEDGKSRRYDMVVQQWRRGGSCIPLKACRSISASLLESHEIFGRVTSLFLGHSPKSVKDRHYAAPAQGLLDEAVGWLHDQLLL
jgi:integrase